MARKSLITLFFIAIAFICVQIFLRPFLRGAPVINQTLSLLYLWTPGIVGLIFARWNQIKIPIFSRPNRFFYSIPFVTFAICLGAFLCSIPFGTLKNVNPVFIDQSVAKILMYGILFFFTNYLLSIVLFLVLFFGGEIYWRGYLWELWKEKWGFKAIWMIALLWSFWIIPITIFYYSPSLGNIFFNVSWVLISDFILSPILTYSRVKGKSVLTATFFYSSLLAAFLFLMILFPIVDKSVMAVYGGLILLALIVYSLILKLYSPSTWSKLE